MAAKKETAGQEREPLYQLTIVRGPSLGSLQGWMWKAKGKRAELALKTAEMTEPSEWRRMMTMLRTTLEQGGPRPVVLVEGIGLEVVAALAGAAMATHVVKVVTVGPQRRDGASEFWKWAASRGMEGMVEWEVWEEEERRVDL